MISAAPAAPAADLEDAALVAALVARDQRALAALDTLYQRHAPVVYGYLLERLERDERAPTARAAAALEEVFRRLWSRPSIAPRTAARLARWLLLHAEQVATALGAPAGRTRSLRLEDVLITSELARRPARAPDLSAENDALFRIARRLATHASPDDVLQTLVETAVELCGAGTAGLSLIETPADGGEPVFRWTHMAGELAGAVGACTPRDHSPCGVTLDRGAPQLFREPERYFECLASTPVPIMEGLVIPLVGSDDAAPIGTIWIVSHNAAARGFDWEDARVMASLASFTSIALQVAEANVQRYGSVIEPRASDRLAIDRQKDEYLASVTHDLKNPLATILGTAQLQRRRLQRGAAPAAESILSALEAIESASNHMSDQLTMLLDVTRSRMGRPLVLVRRRTDLAQLTRQLVAEYQRATAKHRLALTAPDELLGEWDDERLRRALRNLLGNALAYSPDGGDIAVSLALEEGGMARVSIADHGLGVPAADLPFVFERFRRGANVVAKIAGTGIGLADVRDVVEQHGGSVSIESREGEGTTVTIHLPLAKELLKSHL